MIITPLKKPRYVFVSYAKKDEKHAATLISALHQHSIDTWAAFQNIQAGDLWDRSIEEAISQASAVCVLASERSVKSNYVRAEVEYAINIGKAVIPICIDTCVLPLHWNMYQYLSWRIKGDRNTPLRGAGDEYFYDHLETLDGVIEQLCEVLPKSTKSEFIRLLSEPHQENALKDLIRTYYEWLPNYEIRSGRRYERKDGGEIYVNTLINGERVDIEVSREDSSGRRFTYLYLGSPNSKVILSNDLLSSKFIAIYERAKRHMEYIKYGDNRHFLIVYSRRMYWTPKANEYRTKIQKDWLKAFGSSLNIMSYDRLLD